MRWLAAMTCVGWVLLAGCAGSISPRTVRDEVVRQTGGPPTREVEVSIGRLTTALLKAAIGPGADGQLPLAGLTAIELAVYALAPAEAPGRDLDFSQLTPRGWENVVRYKEGEKSLLVMIRGGRDTIHDLALVATGGSEVVYGRLRGTLPTTLPDALLAAVERDGTESVRRQLSSAAGKPAS
jgi:hypothetical protein